MTRFIRFSALAAAVALVGALATAAALVATPRADAATGVRYGLTDDAWLLDGSGTLGSRLTELDSLGAQVVRFSIRWDQVAHARPAVPTDPADEAYLWGKDDAVLNGLRTHGISVVLQLVGTPSWANGGRASNVAPTSGSTFAAFATAVAHRYSWVKRWLIWNEPNQIRWLRPANAAVYTTRLLNPAYAAIHAAISGAQVAGGGTAPRGSSGGVSPVAWITGMRLAHARLDAYAHNPYPLDPKRESPFKGGCGHCTTITMATINKLVTLVSRNFGGARIWLSEYGYQSNPPDKFLGVSPALQARYISEGAYAAYHAPRVDLLIQFLYQDEPLLARFQSGLVTLNNRRKPAYNAFELPLAQLSRNGTSTSLWGELRAPAAGTSARLERRVGARWRTVATLASGSAGFFRWTGTLARGSVVRVHAGAVVGAPLTIS
jgi:hypothetical protein